MTCLYKLILLGSIRKITSLDLFFATRRPYRTLEWNRVF